MLDSLATDDLLHLLDDWAERGWLRALDAAFAGFLAREVPQAPPAALLAAALASHQLGRGHACLDLAATLQDPALALSLPPEGARLPQATEAVPLPDAVLTGLTVTAWTDALAHPVLVGDGPGATPLVRIGQRLYLRRYWQYEQDVRTGIERRLARATPTATALSLAALRQALEVLFARPGTPAPEATDWQRVACALAARSGFAIITGGPGTGKTTTVVRLLALLQALALQTAATPGVTPRPLRIRLAAPTGKAAARLNESIAGAVATLPLAGLAGGEAVREQIPRKVTTLHRLLGTRPGSRRFRHDRHAPLALDVLVIDEASMVDLEMMAAVLDALPPQARLILLGDKDQLASVEAGAVLGELCRRAHEGHYTPATAQWLTEASGQQIAPALIDAHGTALDQAVVMLRHSHRFSAASGIGRLAHAVNAGNPKAVEAVWQRASDDITLVSLEDERDAAFARLVVAGGAAPSPVQTDLFADTPEPARHGYAHYLTLLRQAQPALTASRADLDAWAHAVLQAHSTFQVLCALRRGPWGIEGLNLRIARLLREAGLIDDAHAWYLGRPVLVTRNDYGLGLMNGDIGITLALPDADAHGWTLRVAFATGDGDGGIRWVLPSRLQAVETVYALTVHKSQGSEFDHAALVLPDTLNPILTRELLYTGITRARRFLTVTEPAGRRLLGQAVQRRVLRASGLSHGPAHGPANASDT